MEMIDEFVSRRAVRHLVLRRRNERVAADRDDRWPVLISVHPDTREELLIDSDPDELRTIDFEGHEFMGIPLQGDPSVEPGQIVLRWPAGAPDPERVL